MKAPGRRRRPPLPRRTLESVLAVAAIALVAIAIFSLGTGSSSSSAASKRTATVGKGVVQSTVSGNGTLEPAQKVELSFGASGEVKAIEVRTGAKVTKGEVLAEVDSSSARASLASAEAALIEAEEAVETAAEAEEEETESESAAYEGGATSLLVDYTSKDGDASTSGGEAGATSALEGEEEVAGAGGEGAKGVEEKESPAPSRGKEEATERSEEGSKEAAAEPEAAKAAEPESSTPAESAESPSAGSTGSESTSGAATGAGASVSLPTAEANLREAQLSVKSARQEVRETTLRAPISGTVASISGAVGETISGGSSTGGAATEASSVGVTGGESTGSGSSSAFMVIAQLHRLKMEVSFSESDIGKVRRGQTATVAIDSMEGTELAGRVTKVSLLPSEGSSSVVEYPATILLTQSAKGLRAGMSASAEVVVEQVKDAITVSSEALSGKTVTVEESGKEVTKSVTTGLEGDETTQIVSGLKAGATVVLPEATVATSTAGSASESEGAAAGFGAAGGGFTGGPPTGAGFPGGGP